MSTEGRTEEPKTIVPFDLRQGTKNGATDQNGKPTDSAGVKRAT